MPVYTPPWTRPRLGLLSASTWNKEVRDSMEAIARPPRVRAWRSTAFTIANAATVYIPFTAVLYDSDNFWSSSTPTRLTLPVSGVWQVDAGFYFQTYAGTGTYRGLSIRLNGIIQATHGMHASTGWALLGVSCEVQATAGQWLEMEVWQESGVAITMQDAGQQHSGWMAAHLVARA